MYVPADFFPIFSNRPFLSMIAVLIIAIPMYVCATGSIPIAFLVLKWLSPGTAFVLLMAGPAANFASSALIVREMGRKTAIVYLLSIVLGAIAFGLTIDYLLPAHWFDVSSKHAMTGHEHGFSIFPSMCSAILLVLLIITFIKRYKRHNINHSTMTKEYTIKGMSCPHCQATVIKCISEIKGVKQVDVNLSTGKAVVEGEHNSADIVAAVRNAGFDVFQ